MTWAESHPAFLLPTASSTRSIPSCRPSELYNQPATYKLSVRCLNYEQLLPLTEVNDKISPMGRDYPSGLNIRLKKQFFCFEKLFKSQSFFEALRFVIRRITAL